MRSRFVRLATSDASCTVITPRPSVRASDLTTTYGRSAMPYSRYLRAIFFSTPAIAPPGGARLGLNDDIRPLRDAVLAILARNLLQHAVDRAGERFLARARLEIDVFDMREIRIHHPRIDFDHLRELLRDVVIA